MKSEFKFRLFMLNISGLKFSPSRTVVWCLLRCVKMREMQGAEDEVEGSILKYVTETEFRKQRSRLRIFTHRLSYSADG